MIVFKDRSEAGKKIAEKLKRHANDAAVFAVPRGGVEIGYEVAKSLGVPLDVIVARKLGAPNNPEFGIGAIAPNAMVLDEMSIISSGVRKIELERVIEKEFMELERRLNLYRGGADYPDLSGKVIIIVDDGIATGVTAEAAIESLKRLSPKKLVLAVPVSPADSANRLKVKVDELIVLHSPPYFPAVGVFYEHFPQLTDEEVLNFLQKQKSS